MVTGFEIDAQNIAKEQVRAINRLALAVESLVKALVVNKYEEGVYDDSGKEERK